MVQLCGCGLQYFLLCDDVLVFGFLYKFWDVILLTLKIQLLLQFSWLEKMDLQSSWHEVDDGKGREKFVKLMLQVCVMPVAQYLIKVTPSDLIWVLTL